MNSKTVTHNGTEYNVTKLGCGYEWRLTNVSAPRESIVLNYDQMRAAGFLSDAPVIDLNATRAAQSKASATKTCGSRRLISSALQPGGLFTDGNVIRISAHRGNDKR